MKILFYCPHMSLGGTEITAYDFADYNEKILGNESIIAYNDKDPFNNDLVIEKFKNRFDKVYTLHGPDVNWRMNPEITNPQLEEIVSKENCDAFYTQKFGKNDGVVLSNCKNLILVAAPVCEPHGDVYAYVSEWLSQEASNGKYPSVPSMITPLTEKKDTYRKDLSIPEDALVFGRHGGSYGWSVPFANQVLEVIVNNHPNIYFIFQNTPIPFEHPQIKHIPIAADLDIKSKFISTCNAMIHARTEGESFGCACGEFSIMNKRIITYSLSKDRNHITLLGDKGIYYSNPQEMYDAIVKFKYEPDKDWNGYNNYNPERIMKIFDEVFLK